jgi:hypothetical protein
MAEPAALGVSAAASTVAPAVVEQVVVEPAVVEPLAVGAGTAVAMAAPAAVASMLVEPTVPGPMVAEPAAFARRPVVPAAALWTIEISEATGSLALRKPDSCDGFLSKLSLDQCQNLTVMPAKIFASSAARVTPMLQPQSSCAFLVTAYSRPTSTVPTQVEWRSVLKSLKNSI